MKNIIGNNGFVNIFEEKIDSSLEVENVKVGDNSSNGDYFLAIDNNKVVKNFLSERTRYAFFEHTTDSDQIISTTQFSQIKIDGQQDLVARGIESLWNTSSMIFTPKSGLLNDIFTLNLRGEFADIAGNPNVDIEFILSGSNPEDPDNFRNRVAHEVIARSKNSRTQFSFTFPIFITQEMIDSGSIFVAKSTAEITLTSASLLIKEG